MARVACIMMQKNEGLLIEPWLRYHGYLFGYENLFVFDNGSDDPDVIHTLKRFEVVGVKVDWRHTSPTDFDRKGHIVGDLIKGFQESSRYDLVFPMDCDEFITIIGQNGIQYSRNEIAAHLNDLARPGPMIKVRHCLDNRPGFLDLFRLTGFDKCIVPIGNFQSIDHGFHQARDTLSSDYLSCNIVYTHLHYKPFTLVKKHAQDKLNPFVDASDMEELRNFSGVGRHLVRFFFMSEETYYNSLGDYTYPVVKCGKLLEILRILMASKSLEYAWAEVPEGSSRLEIMSKIDKIVDMSGSFDVESYVKCNPDVGVSKMNPTIHYCLFGFREGRPVVPVD